MDLVSCCICLQSAKCLWKSTLMRRRKESPVCSVIFSFCVYVQCFFSGLLRPLILRRFSVLLLLRSHAESQKIHSNVEKGAWLWPTVFSAGQIFMSCGVAEEKKNTHVCSLAGTPRPCNAVKKIASVELRGLDCSSDTCNHGRDLCWVLFILDRYHIGEALQRFCRCQTFPIVPFPGRMTHWHWVSVGD